MYCKPKELYHTIFFAGVCFVLCCPLFVGTVGSVVAATTTDSPDVVSLTSENFHDVIKSGSWLIDFYAPWCGFCQRLEPIFEAAAKQLKKAFDFTRNTLEKRLSQFNSFRRVVLDIPKYISHHLSFRRKFTFSQDNIHTHHHCIEAAPPVVQFGKVNCDEQGSLCSSFNIQGFPTLKLFRAGRYVSDYLYGRDLVDLVSYGTKLSGPPVQKVTFQNFPNFKKNEVAFLLVTQDEANSDFFYEIADKYREMAVFGITTEREILKNIFPTRSDTTAAQVVVLFNDDEEREEFVISDPSQKEVLDKWIQDRRYPLVSQLSLSNWRALTNGSGKKTVVAVVDPSQKDFASIIARKNRENQLLFGWLDGVKFATMVQRFDIAGHQLPVIIVWDATTNSYWKQDSSSMDRQTIQKFLDDVVHERLKGNKFAYNVWQDVLTALIRSLKEPKIIAIGVLAMIGFLAVIYCMIKLGNDEQQPHNIPPNSKPFERSGPNISTKEEKID